MNNEENRNDATPKMVELIEQDIRKDASECSEGADYQETREGNGFFREEENDRIRNRTHRKNRNWKSQVAALLLCGVLIGAAFRA